MVLPEPEVKDVSRTRHHRHQRKAHAGREYWSRRYFGSPDWTPYAKKLTHRYERRAWQIALRREPSEADNDYWMDRLREQRDPWDLLDVCYAEDAYEWMMGPPYDGPEYPWMDHDGLVHVPW